MPSDEHEMVEACLRQIDFLELEVAAVDRALAELALASPEMRRLMTLPGVSFVTAAALLAAIGDISRFPTPRHLVKDRRGAQVAVVAVARKLVCDGLCERAKRAVGCQNSVHKA